ncbi:isopentenyl-diphosphate Delta-isomerase [Spirochaetota bacterium]
MSRVVLVDENDNELGTEDKITAHVEGKLHRAFSVFVFNDEGKLMLQRRAEDKYHSGGLWSNTVCSHPGPGEEIIEAAHKRLKNEMGFDCPINEIFSFVYQADFENNLSEYELDHVFFGAFNGIPHVNEKEVYDWKWVDVSELKNNIEEEPELYTYWLKEALDKVMLFLEN